MAGKGPTPIARIEDVLVAVFGAFAGGEFLATTVRGPLAADSGFSMLALALAVVGAMVMLGLLALMRRSVGPLRASKSRSR